MCSLLTLTGAPRIILTFTLVLQCIQLVKFLEWPRLKWPLQFASSSVMLHPLRSMWCTNLHVESRVTLALKRSILTWLVVAVPSSRSPLLVAATSRGTQLVRIIRCGRWLNATMSDRSLCVRVTLARSLTTNRRL